MQPRGPLRRQGRQLERELRVVGGGLEGPGAIVSGGMLYFNSGYGGFVGNPGNVLLAFGVD